MIGLSTALANTLMGFSRKDKLVGFPEITVTLAALVGWWDLLPQRATSCLTSISDDKRHDLASATAHDGPQPAFVPFFLDK